MNTKIQSSNSLLGSSPCLCNDTTTTTNFGHWLDDHRHNKLDPSPYVPPFGHCYTTIIIRLCTIVLLHNV